MIQKGFTLIEMLVVLGIISVLASMVMLTFNEAKQNSLLEGASLTTVQALESARSRAMSGVGGGNHGVRITESKISLFSGNDFDTGVVSASYDLPESVTSDHGTALDVIFERITGLPNLAASVILASSSNNKEVEINIFENGLINVAW